MHIRDLLLDGSNGLARVESLRAGTRAVHDGLATIQSERIIQILKALLGQLVTGILNPTVRLHKHSRTKITIAVPPVRWARGRAASAKNTLVHTIQLFAVSFAL